MREKPVVWLGASLEELRAFPDDARREAGYQIGRVQQGLAPSDWKPMPTVGSGVIEIRVHTALEHRVFYITKYEGAVYVLHAFEKRTRKTPQAAIDLARRRLADVLRRRRETGDSMTTKIRRSSGNVFRDLGFPAEEATHLKIRSDLMIRLSKLIDARGLTQSQAAELFGVTQPRISDLVRGKIDRFSIDTLIAMLGHAGVRVQVVLGRMPKVA